MDWAFSLATCLIISLCLSQSLAQLTDDPCSIAQAQDCDVNAICRDTGNNTFRCDCKPGYHGDGLQGDQHTGCALGSAADEIETADPCSLHQYLSCAENARCVELEGGKFKCVCKEGYEGDGFKGENRTGCFLEHTPCTEDTAKEICHTYAVCNNASYCECKAGLSGDGKNDCKDINECNVSPCHPNATCQNQFGTFACYCKAGFTGDGYDCKPFCKVNEDCHQNAFCNESQMCVCKPGFSGDGYDCKDINECELPNDCHENADCTNEPGSYSCTCKNGYTGNGKTCKALPKNCDEIYQGKPTSKDGLYTIDPDFTGPLVAMEVHCDMRPGLGITIIKATNQPVRTRNSSPNNTVEYDTTVPQIKGVVDNSNFCYQYMSAECRWTAKTMDGDDYWVDGNGNIQYNWGGAKQNNMCACGVMDYCLNKGQPCNCDGTKARIKDEGKILDKDLLPIQQVVMKYPNGYANHFITIGDVVCAPKPVDFPIDCDDARFNKKITASGPQIIDIDGSEGPLHPVLVHCDMETYPHVGVTVVPHSYFSPQNLTGPGDNPISYIIDNPTIKKIVEESPFCRQDVEYTCTSSGITDSGSGFTDIDGNKKNYFPGGMNIEGMCGCGLTKTCNDPNAACNCDTIDGKTRKELGTVFNKEDLPIGSLIFNDINTSEGKDGQYYVGPLKCGRQEFGFEANCQRILENGQDYSYTYMIDPDGAAPRDNSEPDNVAPFPAECKMVKEPPHAITVIHHDKNQEEIFVDVDYNYRYVTDAQLVKLRKRSTYCRQNIEYQCNNAALVPSDGSALVTWTEIDGTKNSYFAGVEGKGCDCGFKGTCEGGVNNTCNCNIEDGQTRQDIGTLLEKEDLPVKTISKSDSGGTLLAKLGPLECLEVFPTCSAMYYFFHFNRLDTENMVQMNGQEFTIDPDKAGNVPPFKVTCAYSVTKVPVNKDENPHIETDPNNPNNGPQTTCFNVTYNNGVTPEQLQALEDESRYCTQHLRFECMNAPRTDRVFFQTCDGTTQTGWSGTNGMDMCACGVTGTCEGGPGENCNCDITDNKTRVDEGWIHDKNRLPVCHICMTLDPTTPSEPSRKGSYVLSDLSCNNGPIGLYQSCQHRRNSGETQSGTTFIDADGFGKGDPPIPIYCDFTHSPPVGTTEVRPKEPTTPVPENGTVKILYFVFKLDYIDEVIEESEYCEQSIYVLCNGASAPTDEEGRKMDDWEIDPVTGDLRCKEGRCTCSSGGKEVFGGYVRTEVLPTSQVNLPSQSTEDRNLSVGSMKCFNVYKDCHDIKMAGMDRDPIRNNVYAVDPDGSAGVDLFAVTCDFKTNENIGITEVTITEPGVPVKINVVGEPDPGQNTYAVEYPDATPEQINALTTRSDFCYQGIQYECKETPLINNNNPSYGYFTSYGGGQSTSFGTGEYSNVTGCACTLTKTCPEGKTCHCDAKGPMVTYDYGIVTDTSIMPITQVNFGGQDTASASAEATVTNVRCGPQPFDLPKDCEEAREMKYETGEVLILPAANIKPFFVYCDMDILPTHGVTIIGNDREKPTPADPDSTIKVTYNNATDEQVEKLVETSAYCFQPIKYDCYNTHFIGHSLFSWLGSDVGEERYLGTGAQGECTCGGEHLCGGDLPRYLLTTRKCNCDSGENVWRRDGGIINSTRDLPVSTLRFSDSGRVNSSGIITLGKLYCTQYNFDLNECTMDFDDCHENAVCTNTFGGFKCQCKEGFRGIRVPNVWPNGRNCYDDNECELGLCPYSSNCTNTIGSFVCTCLPGYNQTGPRSCEDIDECKNPALNDCDENARCINLDGTYECRCKRGYRGDGRECTSIGLCSCFGDPHCISFDEKWLHFQGECQYVMSTDGCNGTDATYVVKTEHWDQDTGIKGVTWIKTVTIELTNSVTIQLKQDHVVLVDGYKKTLPYNPDEHLKIRRFGNWVEVYTSRGLQVNWDGFQAVEVIVDKEFKSKTCGLCGNYNKDESDDWRLGPQCEGTGELTTNYVKFGNSYVDREYADANPQCRFDCTDTPTKPECTGENKAISESYCDKLFNENGVFKVCLAQMDAAFIEQYRFTCVYDLCAIPDDKLTLLCNMAQQLAKDCQNNFYVELNNWRSDELCGPDCAEDMEYKICATSENMQTCVDVINPTNLTIATVDSCTEGCYCKEGMVMDGNRCIKKEDCGCYYQDTYYSNGEKLVTTGCSETWVCNENKTFTKTPLECSENATCSLKDGVYGCHCKEGFVGDGTECKYDPCGTNPCNKEENCVMIDKAPGYQCECKMGYQGDCNKCEDVDECATRTHDCPFNSKCVNTPGSYKCECWNGFTKAGDKCEDINECKTNLANCNSSTKCFNRPGGYHCEPCEDEIENKCCACFGYRCARIGKVCGINQKTGQSTTFNSEADMIIEQCESGEQYQVNYRGACKSSCDMVDCPMWQECKLIGGEPRCECEPCTPEESDPTSPKVCSDKLDLYPNMCIFKKVQCRMDREDTPKYNTTTPCEESGSEPPVTPWGDWSPCSTTCGNGVQNRSRNAKQDFDWWESEMFPLSETKECNEEPCPDGPCFGFSCNTIGEICYIEGNTSTSCKCPNCLADELDPVCGRVGGVRETFKNPCEIQKKACQENKTYDILNGGECDALPLNCTKMANEKRLMNDEGCMTQFKIDVGSCDGTCGQMADRCCKPSVKSQQQVAYTCQDGSVKTEMVDIIEACKCKPLPTVSSPIPA